MWNIKWMGARMHKLQSKILALILSIFLIQAADPPAQRSSGAYLQYIPKRSELIKKDLKVLHTYLHNIRNDVPRRSNKSKNHDVISRFLQREKKTEYENLLEKDFIKPLLKLYEQDIHPVTETYTTRINSSGEDHSHNFKTISKDELNFLLNNEHSSPNTPLKMSRRDDNFAQSQNEHIGEILPSGYQILLKPQHRFGSVRQPPYQQLPVIKNRQSFEETSFKPIRKPITFPGERFRPEYEPSSFSSEGSFESPAFEFATEDSRTAYSRPPRLSLPPGDIHGFRIPRRFPSSAREPYWQTAWASSRRPRVIFPSDLVGFRDSTQVGPNSEEPDWLAGDNNLQDLQEQDTRDRGTNIIYI